MTVDSLTEPEAPAAAPAPVSENGQAETPETTETSSAAEEAKPKRGRPKGQTTAKKTRTVELTLTVTGTADGEWQAELKHGSKWIARGIEIPAAAVSRAAKELHEELSGPIDEVINAAREQQAQKVAQLEAELEEAKKALAELEQ
ncbi:DUF6319 family protein [Amycolatopsis sp. YIM 10]|uniref:DUF6319 family protein n=1 Tax=Amycolatopsis sp. YIM 10 TaxID=2653857 RepID=UPI0012905B0E|nr:DUF6319 family protein [Amycolatopsis sp. YIM 10]QFU85683.1 hypothetical protein YIM_02285 [Amycolatopsis sp. YIM 10]